MLDKKTIPSTKCHSSTQVHPPPHQRLLNLGWPGVGGGVDTTAVAMVSVLVFEARRW